MINGDHQLNGKAPLVLVAENIGSFYGDQPILQGLTFSVMAGRVLGFLGPNGAGKTTTIRILTTILEPSSGTFSIDGISSKHPDQIRRKIGVLPESLGFPEQMTAIEYLIYYGRHYGKTRAEANQSGLELLKEVGLRKKANTLISSYSRGMRQRLGIARALINDPVVIFLDEPTLGLDPRGKQELLVLIQKITKDRNVGTLLCSHLLTEVESICDDVVILASGRIVAAGTLHEVLTRAQSKGIRLHVPAPMIPDAQHLLNTLSCVETSTLTGRAGDWLDVTLTPNTDSDLAEQKYIASKEILTALLNAEIPILSFDAETGRLQDIFFQLTEEATV